MSSMMHKKKGGFILMKRMEISSKCGKGIPSNQLQKISSLLKNVVGITYPINLLVKHFTKTDTNPVTLNLWGWVETTWTYFKKENQEIPANKRMMFILPLRQREVEEDVKHHIPTDTLNNNGMERIHNFRTEIQSSSINTLHEIAFKSGKLREFREES